MTTSPIRCLSSQLTTQLLILRNPQGEEPWEEQRRGNLYSFCGKVIIVECGAALLIAMSSVESAAYAVAGLVSIFLYPVTDTPLKYSHKLFQSSCFTCYWNFGNVIIFNPFCINAVTHESFARYTIEAWPRGSIFQLIVLVVQIFLLFSGARQMPPPNEPFYNQIFSMREEDHLYIINQLSMRTLRAWNTPSYGEGQTEEASALQGAAFFKEHILGENRVTESSKTLIKECDPSIYPFVMTRAIYIYALGEKASEPPPPFLKKETQNAILKLRNTFAAHPLLTEERTELASIMRDHTLFNESQSPTIKILQPAAYLEYQGGVFITRCWATACREPELSANRP